MVRTSGVLPRAQVAIDDGPLARPVSGPLRAHLPSGWPCVPVPGDTRDRRDAPQHRFAGGRAELQALARGPDQFGAVTIGQPPGEERPGPGPARGMPADLERAAAICAPPDTVDADIKDVHG